MANINDFNFAGLKALVRVDFNVPLDEKGNITDDTRIRGAMPTLKKILKDGGSLILMSHMGKPKGKINPKLSLGQIARLTGMSKATVFRTVRRQMDMPLEEDDNLILHESDMEYTYDAGLAW